MHFFGIFVIVLLHLWNIFLSADANAMLKPTHRGMMWTRSNYNSAGYNYMGINCGGVGRLKQNDGKCGLCGDPFNGPRLHETGGKYATGAIADIVDKGQKNIPVKILLNSDQGGYFEFRLCVSNGTKETQGCLDKHLLKISEGRWQGDEFAYIVQRAGIVTLTIEVPERVYCDRCVLQWKYVTGNTFGRDEHGVGCLGCGHQETYVNCADLTIKGWETPTTPVPPPTTPIPTTMIWTTSTAAPTTTTPAPTTRAPSTTVYRVNQITKARQTKQTQPTTRYSTRKRRPVTDFDEGSRRRLAYARYPNVYAPVPAPAQAPKAQAVVPKSIFSSNSVNVARSKPKVAVQPPAVIVKVPDKVTTTPINIPQKPKESKKPSSRTRKRSGPFKIPRPPRLSYEQIDALNNNKNLLPHHDPLQKYVKVGSSRIIAAVDFTTLRAQQVQTPPTTSNGDIYKRKSVASPVENPAKSITSVKQNTVDVFSSFGNEMMGTPIKSQTPKKQDVGRNLMNEYNLVPDSTRQSSQRTGNVGQNRNKQSNRAGLLNEFSVGKTNIDSGRKTQKQPYGITNSPTNKPRGNPYFSANMYNSMTSGQTPDPQVQSRSFRKQAQSQSTSGSSVYGGLQQMPQNQFMNNGNLHTNAPAQPRADFTSKMDIFGGSVSKNSFGNNMVNQQKSFSSGSVSRYGQIRNKGIQASPLSNINKASSDTNQVNGAYATKSLYVSNPSNQQNQYLGYANTETRAVPTKTTKLPVTDTSTHRGRNSQSDNIAPWRKLPRTNQNAVDIQDTPVNLFAHKDRNTFKAPAVFERFTNYQVGGGHSKPNALPEALKNFNELRQQENSFSQNTAVSNKTIHLNTGIHSPQNYFGQDHYIAHDVELSNPAFGGPNTQDVQSQQSLDLGHHEITQAQGNSQSFQDVHLNAGLHSPENYFPHGTADVNQNLPKTPERNMPQRQNIGTYNNFNVEKLLIKPSYDNIPTTTTTTTTTQATTTTQTTTLKPTAAKTTNAIDYQMQELKKLREKMERLQNLIMMRSNGYHSETTTSVYSPTQGFRDVQAQMKQEKPVSQARIDVPQTFDKKEIYASQQNVHKDSMFQNNRQSTDFQRNNYEMQTFVAVPERNNIVKPSTIAPYMSKETTKYINHFKTQMLNSIKEANSQKNQRFTPAPTTANILRNKKTDTYQSKAYIKDISPYNTARVRSDVHQQTANTMGAQSQSEVQRKQQNQQNVQKSTSSRSIAALRKTKDKDRREKYRRILELLIERKREKKQNELAAKQMQQNTKQHYSSQQYKGENQYATQRAPNTHKQPTYNSFDPYQQSLRQKPVMAETQAQSVKKQKIIQDHQTTSVRPVETIQSPINNAAWATNEIRPNKGVNPNMHQSNAEKTTLDTLANRLAVGMAERLKSSGKEAIPNFQALPLSSDSVMSALRNIAKSVLKSNDIQRHVPQSTNRHNDGVIHDSVRQDPSLKEIPVVQQQHITTMNGLTTEENKYGPLTTTGQQIATARKEQRRANSGGDSHAARLAKRQELIRKMKQMMLRRRQKLKVNTKTRTGDTSSPLPQVKPPHLGQRDTAASSTQRSNSNNLVHNVHQTNNVRRANKYDDRTTTTFNNASPTTYKRLLQTSQHTTNKISSQTNSDNSAPKTIKYSNNNKRTNKKTKLRLSPEIARSMLSRVRSMLAKQKSNTGGSSNSANGVSTKDVLGTPLKKEMLYKLFQSMKKQNVKTGR